MIMGSRLRRGSTPPGRQAHAVPYRTVIPAVKKLIRAPMLVSTHLWRFGERFAPELKGRLPEIAYYAMDNQFTDFVAQAEFDRVRRSG
jgi:hypothetical protein